MDISNTKLVILLNLITYRWRADELPYVRPMTIANQMGVDRRTVYRTLRSLEERNLVRRLRSETGENGLTIRRFDLSGLVSELNRIADEHQHYSLEGRR